MTQVFRASMLIVGPVFPVNCVQVCVNDMSKILLLCMCLCICIMMPQLDLHSSGHRSSSRCCY